MTNKEAIEILNFAKKVFVCSDKYIEAINLAIKALENEPKKGKWIREDKPWGGFGDRVLVLTCSVCGESFVYRDNVPKFCSECGADMREADNE